MSGKKALCTLTGYKPQLFVFLATYEFYTDKKTQS